MPKKKKSSQSAFGSKSAFVRSLDPKTPAAAVVDQAKKKGISLTAALVYNIRSASKASAEKAQGAPASKLGRRGKGAAASGMTAAEMQLRNAIADLGLVKSTEILESVKHTIRRS